MNSNPIAYQPSWTLFFTWGGFVFLSINFFTGMLLAFVDTQTFVYANLLAFVLFALTLYPSVYLSTKYNINYSEAIHKYISINSLKKSLIFLVVFINIGWYSIQLVAVTEIVTSHLDIEAYLVIFLFSYVFAYGSYRFDYQWLKYFSILTIFLFLVYISVLALNNSFDIMPHGNTKESMSFLSMVLILYGTWAFSSSTVVMDVAKYTKAFTKSYIYILLAMLFSNFSLITLGYLFARNTHIIDFADFISLVGISFGIVLFILNIWSTNDSNFFSSMKALKSLNISKKIVFLIFPFVSAILAISFQGDLFALIGSWLKLMGWIAIPLTLFWWYILIFGKKGYNK